MSKKQNHQDHDDNNDYDENYIETEFGVDYDLIFKNSKAMNKEKVKKNARRRVEDYMERKAFNKKMKDWDNSFDY